jgi:hypothetical protein
VSLLVVLARSSTRSIGCGKGTFLVGKASAKPAALAPGEPTFAGEDGSDE